MTQLTQLTSRKLTLSSRIITMALVALVLMIAQSSTASAQWTTGTNINNTNSGTVSVGTTSPGGDKLITAGNIVSGNVTTHTQLYSTYDSQGNVIMELGYGTATAADTPLTSLVLSKNLTGTNNIVGALQFANRNIANGSEKRLASIANYTDGALNSGALLFNTSSAGSLAERMRITSTGRVGIGTATPGNLLHINSAAAPAISQFRLSANALGSLSFLSFAADNQQMMFDADWSGSAAVARDTSAARIIKNGGKLTFGGKTGLTVGSSFTFTDRLAIDLSSGNVGIGTTAPNYLLDVQANAQWVARFKKTDATNGGIIIDAATGFNPNVAMSVNGVAKWYMNSNTANGDPLQFWESSGTNPRFTLTQAGSVGIGTSAPAYRVDVQGGQLNTSGGLCIAGDCKTAWSQVGASQWTTSGSDVYYNTGNVGIGTASPGAKLAVVANTATNASFSITPDGTNNYYAANNHDALLVDGSLTSPHGNYTSGTVRLVRIKASNGADSLIVGRGGDVVVTPNTGYAAAGLRLFPDASNSFYAGSDYDVLQIGGNSLNFHGTYTGKTVRLIHVTNATGGDAFVIARDGNATFGGDLTVAGNIAAKYQDVAEWVESSQLLSAGTVVVLDHTKSNQVIASSQAYDTRVAGVISAQPGITLGEKGDSKVLVATTGRVKVRVDATGGPIQVGDLLVTSEIEGVAKKSEPLNLGGAQIHRPGTLLGKALEPLAQGQGEILVLLSLQ